MNLKNAVIGAFALAAAAAFAGELDNGFLKGVTDKEKPFYAPGETMTFTLRLEGIKAFPPGEWFVAWDRSGDDGKRDGGKVPASLTEPLVIKTSIDKPGFVRVRAQLVDAKGKVYRKSFTGDPNTPEGKAAMNRFERTDKRIFFDGGAGVQPEKIVPHPEPTDFDAFWAKQYARLDLVPIKPELIELPCGNPDVRLYALSVDCTGGMPVTGYLSVPKAAEKGKKYGIHIGTFGYGVGEQFPPRRPDANAIEFKMNAHGFLLREFGGTDEYYRTYGDKIKSNGYTYAFDPQQNSNPETAYFRGMILRLIRAIQYLKSCPEWDGKDLQVSGNSQGGGFAIWGAGCGEGVTRVYSTVTGFCDMGAELAGRLRGPWPRIKFVKALGYFDAVNFAKRVPSTCRVEIGRAGLGDYTCQPSGLAILWNTLKCPKSIMWVQGSEHGYVPPNYEGRDVKFER